MGSRVRPAAFPGVGKMQETEHGSWFWPAAAVLCTLVGGLVGAVLRGFTGGREYGRMEGRHEARLDEFDKRINRFEESVGENLRDLRVEVKANHATLMNLLVRKGDNT
jgi:hypothetical protein